MIWFLKLFKYWRIKSKFLILKSNNYKINWNKNKQKMNCYPAKSTPHEYQVCSYLIYTKIKILKDHNSFPKIKN